MLRLVEATEDTKTQVPLDIFKQFTAALMPELILIRTVLPALGTQFSNCMIWLPPRDSNPDMLIQSQISPSENKGNKELHSAKSDKSRQNTQTGRKRRNEGGL
jgi:hypothetical protein